MFYVIGQAKYFLFKSSSLVFIKGKRLFCVDENILFYLDFATKLNLFVNDWSNKGEFICINGPYERGRI